MNWIEEQENLNKEALSELESWYLKYSDTPLGEAIYQFMNRYIVRTAEQINDVSDYVDSSDFEE